MTDNGFFSVNDFVDFTRTTRNTLYYYEKIGLISPVSRGKNNYRRYSSDQIAIVNVIRTLQQLGMSLAEIKLLREQRTPELMNDLLVRQVEKIDQKIEGWNRARKLLTTLQNSIRSALDAERKLIRVQFMPAEAIVLGDVNDYGPGENAYDALMRFYHTLQKRDPDLDLNYPVWAVYSGDRIARGDWNLPDHYYLYNPDGHDRRPAAFYAVGYTRGGYGQGGGLYAELVDYIDRNGFEICGDAYEEYPLNELCISDSSNYLMRVMITVRGKKGNR